MDFGKINFVMNVLSDETLLSDSPNKFKVFIADTISRVPISTAEVKIAVPDGRNPPITVVDWTHLTQVDDNVFEEVLTPSLSGDSQIRLLIKVYDEDANEYIIEGNMEGVIR